MKRRARISLLAVVCALPLSALPATAAPAPPQKPVFEDGEAQPVFDPAQVVREDLWVTAPVDSDRDGRHDQVHLQVVRPKETERGLRVPVVYQASPYFAGGNEVPNHNVDTELHVPQDSARPGGQRAERMAVTTAAAGKWAYEDYLLARGYAVVYGESLGTGQSTGCPTTGAVNETIGARSVVDWLNARAAGHFADGRNARAKWSTGQVAMMGVSYNGTLPNAVATTGVQGLEAIVPIGAISNWYDYYRADGAVVAPGGYQGEDADVLAKYVHTRADREPCGPVIDRLTAEQDRITGDYSPFWDERNYLDDVGKVRAAVLSAHGLNDWNVKTKQAAQWYEALRANDVPHKIWWHQAGHTDPISLRRDEWLRTVNRWFTKYLYDQDNGVEREPRATVQREDGSWVEEAEWPAPGTADVIMRPTPGGGERGGLTFAREGSRAVESLRDDAAQRAEDLAAAPSSPNRLAYFSEPTPRPVRVSGTVRADLALTFDRPAANVTALLVDMAPDGSTSVVTRGWTDPQNRDAIDRTSPIEPGKQYRIEVAMQPDDYVVAAGHRLGVVLLSSDHDFTLRPKPGAGISLDLERSRVILPVVRES
ncbi:X-Pro dipeptidyl-peptidase [Saccharopolyspora erythraea NRRL 2338]|uniref:Xaa-Pro dipeptidyl-peptidase n=2 Tax=Saccharopolyspora erythraea TaxID=1836 RepID=A4FAL3_SACEN|nr:Xaa-Pro dipeptidyl-peptidase [Saccharopolyspora erythraea]EQD84350.1 x-prolyl-dipeptidyl aminopeptidase [Saccharopolyspora erythraea D]PFG94873.1 X-Pro dipeptidyl-peptidase [Saccharopolyspora erythraea NRRL 2338]QRK91575.1 Xaa-Pro dipeptidyl-peptidase [Saccharopolyspora erythraea]CAM01088.1 x-prolyl-dipeptidyl aminopeptidase [Saccharopolyspora erythraea NRRL 2338]